MQNFSAMLRELCQGIPAQTINNLVKVFGAADLINAVVASDIHTVHLPTMKLTAGIIPVPDLERFNPKLPFGASTWYAWGLAHGTSITGASTILIKGLIRPADWEHDDDPEKSQLPTFGLFSVGSQINRGDTELPRWAEQQLLDRASKRGKGQQPILVGAHTASLASHGGLPSHLVVNSEPNFRAISYRSIAHADPSTNRALSCSPPPPRGILRTDEDHLSASEPPFPRPKQASSSTAPGTTLYQTIPTHPDHPFTDNRSVKRPRTAYMVEAVNRFETLPNEGASAHARPAQHSVPEPEADPPPIHHRSVESDSDEPEPAAAKASSPTPTIPGYVSPAPVIPVDPPAPVPNHLDPAIADHRNRPWPPCDDRELVQYKMDTKSRPSWKTIAKRMTRTVESCQARWQWLKNTHFEPDKHPRYSCRR